MGFSSIRWRIVAPFVALTILIPSLAGAYAMGLLREAAMATLRARLTGEARIIADQALPLLASQESTDLEALVSRSAALLEGHVTVVGPDGQVLADSHDLRAARGTALYQIEMRAALADGWGSAVRSGGPLGDKAMYVAVQGVGAQGEAVVVRVGVTLRDLEAGLARLRTALVAGGLLAVLLALSLGLAISRRMTQPLARLTSAVESMTQGNLRAHLVPTGRDEIGGLANALDRMLDRLQDTITSLGRERAQLVAVLDNMADGVLIADAQGRVQLVNPAAMQILGTTADKALGMSLAQAVREHQIIEIWRACHESGEAQIDLLETGPRRPVLQVIATPLAALGEGACLLILQDVSQVRNSEATRREFVSNMSHELRTPLASMRAVVDTLRDGALDDPPAAHRFLDHLDAEIDALTQMVQELLELSRIESGQVPIRLMPITVKEVIAPPVERLRPQAERGGLSLAVDLPAELPRVLGDTERARQVVTNLVHNAIKFTPPGGHVHVSAARSANEVIISVHDTGVGIPEGLLPRIFERFFKADRARASVGTGLGLAIAKHIVQAHGGRIWAESVEGRGSTFRFSLLVAGKAGSAEADPDL